MTMPDKFDDKLQQQYQHQKAMHLLPAEVKKRIFHQHKQAKRYAWAGLWRNTQLALSCAAIVVMAFLLSPSAQQPQPFYQIVVSEHAQYKQLQQHRSSAQAEVAQSLLLANTAAYQQYLDSSARGMAFHQQIGLLRQHEDQWLISVCDDLLLTVDRQLLTQLYLPLQPERFAQQQWVEFISNQAGQLIAIAPASDISHCPGS